MAMTDDAGTRVELLNGQLTRMRGMLYGYSDLFFRRIRDWALVAIGLLVLGAGDIVPAAPWIVPFVVPFAFLETAYLFWYTVFARRFAERLERRINALLGHDVLIAHRLEAAYFYPPEAPRIAAISRGNPLGMLSIVTVGYSAGAALLWGAGFADLLLDGPRALALLAVAWTGGHRGLPRVVVRHASGRGEAHGRARWLAGIGPAVLTDGRSCCAMWAGVRAGVIGAWRSRPSDARPSARGWSWRARTGA